MIVLDGVTKTTGEGAKQRAMLTAARVSLPTNRRIAVLARRPGDKKTFINLLAGLELPDSGRIVRNARVSFPAGHLGGFTNQLSVRLNVDYAARLYGADVNSVVDFVAKATRLGAAYDKPYGDLPKAKKRDFSQILAFSIPFDVYLLSDEVVRGAEKRSQNEIRALFDARAKTCGMIIAAEDLTFAREFCEMGLVLSDGRAHLFKSLEQAIAFYENAVAGPARERKKKRKAKKKGVALAGPVEEKVEGGRKTKKRIRYLSGATDQKREKRKARELEKPTEGKKELRRQKRERRANKTPGD
jgi:capsular polysaccharide transport system ATP-binding protein